MSLLLRFDHLDTFLLLLNTYVVWTSLLFFGGLIENLLWLGHFSHWGLLTFDQILDRFSLLGGESSLTVNLFHILYGSHWRTWTPISHWDVIFDQLLFLFFLVQDWNGLSLSQSFQRFGLWLTFTQLYLNFFEVLFESHIDSFEILDKSLVIFSSLGQKVYLSWQISNLFCLLWYNFDSLRDLLLEWSLHIPMSCNFFQKFCHLYFMICVLFAHTRFHHLIFASESQNFTLIKLFPLRWFLFQIKYICLQIFQFFYHCLCLFEFICGRVCAFLRIICFNFKNFVFLLQLLRQFLEVDTITAWFRKD